MKRVIEKLSDFSCDESDSIKDCMGWEDMPQRYAEALRKIRASYRKFSV